MTPETKQRIKLALRRWILRQTRYLFDALEDRLHNAEVKLRFDLEQRATCVTQRAPIRSSVGAAIVHRPGELRAPAATFHESFAQWEGRRAGVLPQRKRPQMRPRLTAHAFDLRFSREAR